MSFLAPLFLLGGLAIAGPIIFHMIRRTTKDVVPFSSLMFLAPSPPRVTRRSRVENLWLLLLRVLALLLLALSFGRPLWQRMTAAEAPGREGKRTLILLDTSASMRRDDLWPRTLAKTREMLGRLREESDVSLVAFDRTARTLIPFEKWAETDAAAREVLGESTLADLQPTWDSTNLGTALLHASEALNSTPEASKLRREIIIISDLQEGAQLKGLQGYEWPHGTEVITELIKPKALANAHAEWLSGESEPSSDSEKPTVRIRVTNEIGAPREQFTLRWAGNEKSVPITAYIPAGQARILKIPAPTAAGTLVLSGDEVPFDNETFVAPLPPDVSTILFAGKDDEADSQGLLYFLKRAFPETRRAKIELATFPGTEAIPAWELGRAQLLVLGEAIAEPTVKSARAFAEAGKIVLLPMANTGSAKVLGALTGVAELPAEEATVRNYAMLSQIEFGHPLFTPFADPRYSDFSKIHFWKYRKIAEQKLAGANVLARFDSGDPALVQVPIGRGSVMALASSWRPADSQLALSTKFVPLMHSLLAQSGARPARPEQAMVGDLIPMPPSATEWTVTAPSGAKTEVASGGHFTATTEPGLYKVSPGESVFAVNLAPDESRTSPMPMDRLKALGVPLQGSEKVVKKTDPRAEEEARRAESESHQKLWRWLLAVAVVVVLGETLLAGKLSGRVASA